MKTRYQATRYHRHTDKPVYTTIELAKITNQYGLDQPMPMQVWEGVRRFMMDYARNGIYDDATIDDLKELGWRVTAYKQLEQSDVFVGAWTGDVVRKPSFWRCWFGWFF